MKVWTLHWLLACTLVGCAQTNPATRDLDRRAAVYGSFQYFRWTEDVPGVTVEETGPLVAVGFQQENAWNRFRVELFGGTVDYDGALQDGSPFQAETEYLGVLGEFDANITAWRKDDYGGGSEVTFPRSLWNPYVGGGARIWARDLAPGSSAGYTELWGTLYAHIGMGWSQWFAERKRLYVDGRLGLSLINFEEVDLGVADVSLNPGIGPMFKLEAGYQIHKLHLALFLDVQHFTESDPDDAGIFIQPASTMARFGFNAGFTW